MSWSLYNHNYDRPPYVPPTVPQNPVAEPVYYHPNPKTSDGFDYLMEGTQIVKSGDTIICSVSSKYEYVRSADAGETWTVLPTPYSAVDNLPAYSQFDQYAICPVTDGEGNWYMRVGRVSIGSTQYSAPARSVDDGATFTLFDATKAYTNTSPDWGQKSGMTHQLMLDSGVLVSRGNDRYTEFSDPANANSSSGVASTGGVYCAMSLQIGNYFIGNFYQYSVDDRMVTYDVSTNVITVNQAPSFVDDFQWATDGEKVLAGRSAFQGANGRYWVYYPNTTPVQHTFDDIGPNDEGDDQEGLGFFYGNGIFIAAWYYQRTSPNYRKKIYFKTSPTGLTGSWSATNILTLTRNKELDSTSKARHINILHHSNDLWYIMYLEDGAAATGNRTVIDSFTITQTVKKDYALLNAVNAQAPDIFFKSDDLIGAASLFDLGRKHYTNNVVGSVTFEQDSLIDDGGSAILVDAASDTGVLVQNVPTPSSHAHFFVLSHDGAAAVRILACSGDYSDTGAIGYYVFLAANHKLGVAVYDGGWEYYYSTAALTADTTYLCAVSVATSGKATFYIGDAWDSAVDDVPHETLPATILSLGGGWTGDETLSQSADGVTLDYYALIPLTSFDYKLLVEANGGTYTSPTTTTTGGSVVGVKFLIHGDESALTPVYVGSQQVYQAINSVPGTTNRIHNNYSATPLTSDGKFGAGALHNRGSTQGFITSPWFACYWNEGNLLEIGLQDFTYDLQAMAEWDNGLCYLGCNQGLYRRGSAYYRFGGITAKITKASATTANISLYVGCKLEQALAGSKDSIELHYTGVQGYIDGDYNHVAVCRQNGAWYVFLNGEKGGIPVVVRRNGMSEATVPVLKGGQWLLGGYYTVPAPGQTIVPPRFYVAPSDFDEIRLIVGRAEFTEPFTPPTAPYDYG